MSVLPEGVQPRLLRGQSCPLRRARPQAETSPQNRENEVPDRVFRHERLRSIAGSGTRSFSSSITFETRASTSAASSFTAAGTRCWRRSRSARWCAPTATDAAQAHEEARSARFWPRSRWGKRATRIELVPRGWKPRMQPLHHARARADSKAFWQCPRQPTRGAAAL